jgi:hypothetical protein
MRHAGSDESGSTGGPHAQQTPARDRALLYIFFCCKLLRCMRARECEHSVV